MAVTIPVGKFCVASLIPVDAQGNPATIDGVPEWSWNSALLSPIVSADGLSAELHVADIGSSQIQIVGDADLGEGVKQFVTILDVATIAGEAVSFAVSVGPLVDEPVENLVP